VALTFDQQTQKTVGFFYSIGAITLCTFKALGQAELKLLAIYGFYFSGPCALDLSPTEGSGWKRTPVIEWNVFTYGAPVTLTFDLLSPKSIGFFYSIRAIILWSFKALCQWVLELLSGNGFHSSGHCDLDLWPTDPKINRVFIINKGYHPMKFEGSGSKGTCVIERKQFLLFGSLWPRPLTYWPQNQ